MRIIQIVGGNLKRRWVKTAFLTAALALGVAMVVALMSIVAAMRLELGNELDKFGPNIVIAPKVKGQELYYGGGQFSKVAFDIKPLTEGDLVRIRTIQDRESINIVSPKLVGEVKLNGQPALLVGVETKNEFSMKPWFTLETLAGTAPGEDPVKLREMTLPANGLILGAKAARGFALKSGDPVAVNQQEFLVTGVLKEFGSEEDSLVYADLGAVQKLFGADGVYSMIEVSGFCNFCPIEDMASQMTDVLPNARVTAIRQAALVREETIDGFAAFSYIFSVVAVLATILFAFITMLSAVNERRVEIGIFRAIGFRRSLIVQMIVLEALIVSLLAGVLGFALGSAIAMTAGPVLAQLQAAVPWDFELFLPAVGLSVAIAVAASLYPALKAAQLDPLEAIRYI